MRATAPRSGALRDQLRSVFEKAKVPTNPTIAVEILRLADDPSSTAEQFAAVIQSDAALAARLLEMANTASFGQREPVTTIKRAVTLLGLRRIRMTSLGFQLVGHLDRLGTSSFDLKTFWQHSVLRACLAREIALRVAHAHAEEAFLIGLLQDCGILLLVQVLGEPYAELHRSANLSPTAFYEQERQRFPNNHAEAIYALAREWRLPPLIAEPLARHHQRTELPPGASDIDHLAAVSYLVGSLPLADMTPAASEPGLSAYASTQLGLNEDELQECVRRAGEAYAQTAPLMADHLPDDLDVADLLDQANRHLSMVAADAESRLEQIEAERDRIRDQQIQLKSALGQYRERAARDPLTRLLNRGALGDAALACIRDCAAAREGMGVLFLDIDDFKLINDKHGHRVGDEVLRMLADTVLEVLPETGYAGRYGGEEFVVVLPRDSEFETRRLAERLLDKVRDTRPGPEYPPLSITVSIGAVWTRPGPDTAPEMLFTAADELMYQAKLGGKDRVMFKVQASPATMPGEPSDVTPEDFRRVAIELNKTKPTKRFASMRKRERQGLLATCEVCCFVSGAPSVRTFPGYVRNISTGGVGVLTTRPMLRGEPIELEIDERSEHRPLLFLAGLVAFCRHVKGSIYEIGIQLLAQGKQPIIVRGAATLADQQEWVQEALRAAHGRELSETA